MRTAERITGQLRWLGTIVTLLLRALLVQVLEYAAKAFNATRNLYACLQTC